jgi:hypothetical protein
VFTGLEIAESEDVAGLELDHLAVADIVHEFDVGRGALHILHQRGWDQGCWNVRRNLSGNSEDGSHGERSERH